MGGMFRKGLSDGFIEALAKLAQQDASWWSDVLADKDLIIAVRNEYLNVYWQGQSLFAVGFKGKSIVATTHPKYLMDPALSDQISFDGSRFAIDHLIEKGFIEAYNGPGTLKKMKTAAGAYSGVEKQGVHVIATGNEAVVDVEIAMSTSSMDDVKADGLGKLPRIDVATFKEGPIGPELMFWEAKHFGNGELRAKEGEAPVVGQIQKYRTMLSHHHTDVVISYKRVAKNLQSLAQMSRGHRSVSAIVRDVADGKDLYLDPTAVGVVIFGFDAAQRDDERWVAHFNKLKISSGKRVIARGNAGDVRL